MATWDSADLLSRVRRYINRPTDDELVTDAFVYALLTEAQTEVLAEIATLAPLAQMGAPVLLTTTDSGVTYTFGTDANGHAVFPLACEVYGTVEGRELRACSWLSWGDFVIEGDKIRMPGNRALTFDDGPYARFVRADASISASIEPILKPAPARILLVYKALIAFAAVGGLRDPSPWEEKYVAAWKTWLTAMRTQFADATGVANEDLVAPHWWVSYGRV